MLIFLKVTPQNCHNIDLLLKAYCKASGQEVSAQKSSLFFGANTLEPIRSEMCSIMGMAQVTNPGQYLGILTVWGLSKCVTIAFVKEWVLAKIQGWKQNFLLHVGREVLIKAIVQAIHAYPTTIFCFLDTLC